MERTVLGAISAEKVKRLEAELEVDHLKSKQAGPFAEAENQDFRYIWDTLDRWEPVTFRQTIFPQDGKNQDGKNKDFRYKRIKDVLQIVTQDLTVFVHVRSIVPFLAGPNDFEYSKTSIPNLLELRIGPNLNRPDSQTQAELMNCPDFTEELVMFGFIERRERPQPAEIKFIEELYTLVYAQKIERFKYWLAFNGLLRKEIEWSIEKPAESSK
jgi:hypothetical protein